MSWTYNNSKAEYTSSKTYDKTDNDFRADLFEWFLVQEYNHNGKNIIEGAMLAFDSNPNLDVNFLESYFEIAILLDLVTENRGVTNG